MIERAFIVLDYIEKPIDYNFVLNYANRNFTRFSFSADEFLNLKFAHHLKSKLVRNKPTSVTLDSFESNSSVCQDSPLHFSNQCQLVNSNILSFLNIYNLMKLCSISTFFNKIVKSELSRQLRRYRKKYGVDFPNVKSPEKILQYFNLIQKISGKWYDQEMNKGYSSYLESKELFGLPISTHYFPTLAKELKTLALYNANNMDKLPVISMCPEYEIEKLDPLHRDNIIELWKQYTQAQGLPESRLFQECNSQIKENFWVYIQNLDYIFSSQISYFPNPSEDNINSFFESKKLNETSCNKLNEVYTYVLHKTGMYLFKNTPENKISLRHSSFFAGKEIISAGELHRDFSGKIRVVNNFSGHYKPPVETLKYVLLHLISQGFNLNYADIIDKNTFASFKAIPWLLEKT